MGALRILVISQFQLFGIEVDSALCIINYDLPFNKEYYIYRLENSSKNIYQGNTIKKINYLLV
jgi:hypothetical protein